jgi:DNA-binding transcriptional LysR family regulator
LDNLFCEAAIITSLESLLEFVAVVERGTFTAAARQLGVSVSHVSRQIADLEARLSAQLFARTTRKLALTEAGRRLFDTSQPLLHELLRAQENVLAAHDTIGGEIRISLAGKFGEEQLVPLLTTFCQANPAIELELDVSARNVDLVGEGFHLAVRMGPLENSAALKATRLVAVPMLLLASADLLARLRPITTPADLPAEHCLRLGNRPWDFVRGQQQSGVEPAGRIKSNSGAVLIQAARDGLGIVNVPAYYATGKDGAGLQRLLPDWASVEQTTFYLVFPAARHMPVRVRRLIDFLLAQCAGLSLAG